MFTYKDIKDIECKKKIYCLKPFLQDFYYINYDNFCEDETAIDLLTWANDNEVNLSTIIKLITDNADKPINLVIKNYDFTEEWFEGYLLVDGYRLDVTCTVPKN